MMKFNLKNWKAFDQSIIWRSLLDINLFLELYSDSVKWSPPNWNNNQILLKRNQKKQQKFYLDNFENLKPTPGGAVIGGDGA